MPTFDVKFTVDAEDEDRVMNFVDEVLNAEDHDLETVAHIDFLVATVVEVDEDD